MKIWFHGTNKANAESILKEGFRPDTWFAAHLEDALAFGGNYVFEVALEAKEEVGWQIHVLEAVPADRIISHFVFQKQTLLDYPDRRREVFEANANGGVSGLHGKIEYHKWTQPEPPKELV